MNDLETALTAVAAQIDALSGPRSSNATADELLPIGVALLKLRAVLGQPALEQALVSLAASVRQANRLMTVAQAMGTPAGLAVLGRMAGLGKLATMATLGDAELQALADGECLRGLGLAVMVASALASCRAVMATMSADERALLINFRRCDDAARQHVHQAARLLAQQR